MVGLTKGTPDEDRKQSDPHYIRRPQPGDRATGMQSALKMDPVSLILSWNFFYDLDQISAYYPREGSHRSTFRIDFVQSRMKHTAPYY